MWKDIKSRFKQAKSRLEDIKASSELSSQDLNIESQSGSSVPLLLAQLELQTEIVVSISLIALVRLIILGYSVSTSKLKRSWDRATNQC